MQQKKSLIVFFKKLFFFIFLIGVSLIIFFSLSYFKIKKIIILNKKNNLFITGLKSIENRIIFLTDNQTISDLVLKNNPQIENVAITKKLPDTIIIQPQFSIISAQLKTNDGFFLLSKKGKIIKKTKTIVKNLPLVNFYQLLNFYQYQSGDNLDFKEILIALEFLEKLKNLGFNDINTIDIKSFDVIIFNKENQKEIIISAVKNKEKLLYEIDTIIKRNRINQKNLKKIDLRFNKPIIVLYD